MKKKYTLFDADGSTKHSAIHSSPIGHTYHFENLSLVVENVIAEGGFGVVLRTRSTQGETFALKRSYVNDAQKLAVCKREIQIVKYLVHKNIIRYINSDIHQLSSGVFEVLLVTAFYPNSLSQLLKKRKECRQRMTEDEVLRVMCDICEAVSRLHHCETPIIHRDLKIENILIDEKQNFVLCDFGSATSRVLHPTVHGVQRCEEEIATYTTLAYRAPEMIDLYLSIPLGPQIDIWALGCILYYMCFAALPFAESTIAILSNNYTIPHTSPYSERLHKLIGYLLSGNASERPDAFQASVLSFSLAGRQCPVENLNHLPVPDWQDLPDPRLQRSQQQKQPKTNPNLAAQTASCDNRNAPARNACTSYMPSAPREPTVAATPRHRPQASGYQQKQDAEIPALTAPPGSQSRMSWDTVLRPTLSAFASPAGTPVCDATATDGQAMAGVGQSKPIVRGHYRNASDGSCFLLPKPPVFPAPDRCARSVSHLPTFSGSPPTYPVPSSSVQATAVARNYPTQQQHSVYPLPSHTASWQCDSTPVHNHNNDSCARPRLQEEETEYDSALFGATFDAIRRVQAPDAQ